MSYNFNDKNYGDYFKSLEKSLEEKSNSGSFERQSRLNSERNNDKKPVNNKSKTKNSKKLKICALAIAAIFVFVCILALFSGTKGEKAGKRASVNAAVNNNDKIKTVKFYETDETKEIPATNDAESVIVVNTDKNEIVACRSPHKKVYPASTTKIMTILTAVDYTDNYDDTFTMTSKITDQLYIAEATVAGFSVGEKITITDLMYGTILPSGGDAAIGLAEKLAGSEAEFVKLMNKKAEKLGLKNTHFTNVTGLFDKNHYTTAYDMAIILKTAEEESICKKVLSTYQYTTKATEKHPNGIELSSTLFNYMYGTEPETATILGGKTGYVNESGYCIASFGKNNANGNNYIVVSMKNSSRWPAFYGQIDLYKNFAK